MTKWRRPGAECSVCKLVFKLCFVFSHPRFDGWLQHEPVFYSCLDQLPSLSGVISAHTLALSNYDVLSVVLFSVLVLFLL